MSDTTKLLEHYSALEIALLLDLVRDFKGEFADVAQRMFIAARKKGLREELVHASITTECLMLAACMHVSSRDAFLETAQRCLDDVQRERPTPNVMTQ